MVQHKDSFGNKSIKIPFFHPSIDAMDKKSVNDALRLPLLTDGPKLLEFESKFAKLTGAKYAVGVSNATSALHLSLKSLGIGKGDEVIIPDMTFVATASSVLIAGATPVLVDVERTGMNISVESVKNSITPKTKAILPVHFAGKVCNIVEIMKTAKKHNLTVIEDCAHAIGARYQNKHVGTFGDAGCFSFYPTKNITTLEGGMVITNSKKIEQYVRAIRNHGITKSLRQRFSGGRPWDYDVSEPGYNYRMDEVRAALGTSQLRRLSQLNLQRKRAYQYYNSKLKEIDGIVTPTFSTKGDHVFHLYVIKVLQKYGLSRDNLFIKLQKNGIRSSVHYKPLHKFTVFRKHAKVYDILENSDELYKQVLSLPLYPTISKKEQDLIVRSIKSN